MLLPHQTLVFITHGETLEAHTITINLKYLRQHGIMNLNYQMVFCIRYSRLFENILEKRGEDIDEPSVQKYVKKIENRITFKIKNGYSLALLTLETMKLLESIENKISKDKNGENVPHIEITEVVLVYCNIVNKDYQQVSRVLYTFVPSKPFGSLLETSPTSYIFLKTFNSE